MDEIGNFILTAGLRLIDPKTERMVDGDFQIL